MLFDGLIDFKRVDVSPWFETFVFPVEHVAVAYLHAVLVEDVDECLGAVTRASRGGCDTLASLWHASRQA